jgi:hypothetical protein
MPIVDSIDKIWSNPIVAFVHFDVDLVDSIHLM